MVQPFASKATASQRWLQILLILAIALGILFRCVAVDRKVYSVDESFTALRVSGYAARDLIPRFINGQTFPVEALQPFQRPAPEKTLMDTVQGLATEEAQHVPFYFGLARIWSQIFGGGIATSRTLSICFSLLVLPALYWLGQELFKSPNVTWMAIALYALSPFQVLYAQEARPYSLWTLTTVLSSAALLRALRRQAIADWALYAGLISFSLYSFLFSALVILGQGLYVVGMNGFRWSRTLLRYGLAVGAGVLAFTPWLIVIGANLQNLLLTTSYSRQQVPLIVLMRSWLLNISYAIIDFDQDFTSKNLGLHLLVLVLVLTAFYVLIREAGKSVWLFVLTLMGCNILALVIPDLIDGGRRSGASRYLTPAYLGLLLTLAYLFATRLQQVTQLWQQKAWQLLLVLVLWSSILSDVVMAQATTWWNKLGGGYYAGEVARVINQAERPLLITESDDLLAMSHQLKSGTLIQWVPQRPFQLPDGTQRFVPQLPPGTGETYQAFLYQPTEKVGQELQQVHGLRISSIQEWDHELNPTDRFSVHLLTLEK